MRQPGQAPALSGAQVRRSISTSYYALFQFLLDECAADLVGRSEASRRRRALLARAVDHRGLAVALQKAADHKRKAEIGDFLRIGSADGEPSIPPFLANMAAIFAQAQAQRHAADYDLNAMLTELDATSLIEDVEAVIATWLAADSTADRELKHAVSLLVLLKGKLRAADV